MITVFLMTLVGMLGVLVLLLLLMNFKIARQVEKMRKDFAGVDVTRSQLSARLTEMKALLDGAERDRAQLRERFEFSESFPAMDAYSASVRCEVSEGRYAATLAFSAEAGSTICNPGTFQYMACGLTLCCVPPPMRSPCSMWNTTGTLIFPPEA